LFNISNLKKATFAAGCFWGVEAEFKKISGVLETRVGYTGGHTEKPSYKEVCLDKTGHAEAVEVIYDPEKVSYETLLEKFWNIHNPTTLNRQGPDRGSQYRSVIFYHDEEQKKAAEQSKESLQKSGRYNKEIVTFIKPAQKFWEAEEYHQDYFDKNPNVACNIH
jgi:peptide-methionine (S)-S-oxide reductase